MRSNYGEVGGIDMMNNNDFTKSIAIDEFT